MNYFIKMQLNKCYKNEHFSLSVISAIGTVVTMTVLGFISSTRASMSVFLIRIPIRRPTPAIASPIIAATCIMSISTSFASTTLPVAIIAPYISGASGVIAISASL